MKKDLRSTWQTQADDRKFAKLVLDALPAYEAAILKQLAKRHRHPRLRGTWSPFQGGLDIK